MAVGGLVVGVLASLIAMGEAGEQLLLLTRRERFTNKRFGLRVAHPLKGFVA